MSSSSFQNEVPKARVNIKLDLHTGGAQKKVELPLKLMVMGGLQQWQGAASFIRSQQGFNQQKQLR
ncbi:hypothetical protein PMHK_58020 [Pseudomonas sp. MHK4]